MDFSLHAFDVFSGCILISYLMIFAPYQKRKYFLIKHILGILLGETVLYFFCRLVTISVSFLSYLVNFSMIYVVWAIVIYICYNIRVRNLIFGCGVALAIEQFCGAVRDLCFISGYSFGLDNFALAFLLRTLIVYLPLYIPFGFFYIRYKFNLNEEANKTSLSSIITVVVVFFCLIINRFVKWDDISSPWYWTVGRTLYAMVCSSLTIFIYYGFSLFNKMKKENTIIEANRKMDDERYQEWKQFYELVNISLHDIRHALSDGQESNEYAKKMFGYFADYEHRTITGNDTMDVLLYEKGNICHKHEINFTHLVDGSALKKMAELDIYSLFSNLIDNAINAVISMDKEKRNVTLVVKKVGDAVSVHMSNFYDKNQPKVSSPLHGYGLKSVNHVLEKYHGTMNNTVSDEIYETDLLLLTSSNNN